MAGYCVTAGLALMGRKRLSQVSRKVPQNAWRKWHDEGSSGLGGSLDGEDAGGKAFFACFSNWSR